MSDLEDQLEQLMREMEKEQVSNLREMIENELRESEERAERWEELRKLSELKLPTDTEGLSEQLEQHRELLERNIQRLRGARDGRESGTNAGAHSRSEEE